MALDQAANFVRGSLTAAVGPADTTFEVANASQYPDPSTRQYNLVVWDADNHARPDQDGNVEIVRVSARDTTADELTVSRGEENTSAASHPNGAAVQLSPTAKVVEDVQTKTQGLSDDGTALDIDDVVIDGRQVLSDQYETVTVPGDYATIQEAVNAAPLFGKRQLEIEIDAGTYNEDVFVPPMVNPTGYESEVGSISQLYIKGDQSSPSNVEVDSFYVSTVGGPGAVFLAGFRMLSETPYSTHTSAIEFGGGGEVHAQNIEFAASPTNGIALQKADATVRETDFSNVDFGVWAKRAAHVDALDNSGTANEHAYFASDGGLIVIRNDSASGSNGIADVGNNGHVRNKDTGEYLLDTYRANIGDAVGLSANQTGVPSGTDVKVQYDDPLSTPIDDNISVDASTHEISVNNGGVFQIRGKVSWDAPFSADGDQAFTAIYVNGTEVENFTRSPNGSEFRAAVEASWTGDLDAGDSIHVKARQDSGSDSTIDSGQSRTRFEVHQLG